QMLGRLTQRRRNRNCGWNWQSKLCNRVTSNDFNLQAHRFEPQFDLVRQLLGKVAGTENAHTPNTIANLSRKLAQGDAGFAGDQLSVQFTTARCRFQRSLQSAQRSDAAGTSNLQSHRAFANS